MTCFPNETHDYVYLVKICRRRIMISNIYTRFRYLFFCSAREKVVLATSVSRFFSLLDPKGLHFSQFANKMYIFLIILDCLMTFQSNKFYFNRIWVEFGWEKSHERTDGHSGLICLRKYRNSMIFKILNLTIISKFSIFVL